MGIKDTYVAFCFNEACEYILHELTKKDGRKPKWKDEPPKGGSEVHRSTDDDDSDDLISYLKGLN